MIFIVTCEHNQLDFGFLFLLWEMKLADGCLSEWGSSLLRSSRYLISILVIYYHDWTIGLTWSAWQDRGTVYSCCKPHTRGAKHQHRWHADGTCRQLQVGRIISNDGYLEEEIKSRISKASQALGRLRTKVLNHHNICLFTKLKVYRAVILTFLLRYGCETWILYRSHVSSLPDSKLPDWVCRATSDDP